jgi:hypothetical protein
MRAAWADTQRMITEKVAALAEAQLAATAATLLLRRRFRFYLFQPICIED